MAAAMTSPMTAVFIFALAAWGAQALAGTQALVALGAQGLPAQAVAKRGASDVEEDWAWSGADPVQMANEVAEEQLAPEPPRTMPRAGLLLKYAGKSSVASEPAEGHSSLDGRELQAPGAAAALPSVEEIRAENVRRQCETIASPLARSHLKKVAPVGTPCIFRADAWDEALHCIDSDSGRWGQYGWCWTNLDRSEWGSCSKDCPLAGDLHKLGAKLATLENLVGELSELTLSN
mmetsp:Transcript_57163/g.162290  ORF Transcript_57163/g.162290 Transcript_57163/m.162290 type:complete len:234 (-) Transcript_57163:53-754(-)